MCVKVVPDPSEITFDPQTKTVNRRNARNILNAADLNALEWALKVKAENGATVWTFSMGPPFAAQNLADTIAMGADDAFLVSDRALAESDTLPTSLALAKAIEKAGGADLVLCGDETSDSATGQVPAGLAEHLNYAQVTFARDLAIEPEKRVLRATRELEGGQAIVESDLPCVVSILSGSNRPRYTMFATRQRARRDFKPKVWSIQDLGLARELVGAAGSPTRVSAVTAAPSAQRDSLRIKGTPREAARKLVEALEARGAFGGVR